MAGVLQLQKLDPGAAVALGAPLHVRMFVPLWIVNATSLPVAALVVPVAPPRQSSEREGQEGQDLLDAAESIRLKVLETDAGDGASSSGARLRKCALSLLLKRFSVFWRTMPDCELALCHTNSLHVIHFLQVVIFR